MDEWNEWNQITWFSSWYRLTVLCFTFSWVIVCNKIQWPTILYLYTVSTQLLLVKAKVGLQIWQWNCVSNILYVSMVVSIMGNHMYTILIYCFLLVKLSPKIIFGKTGGVKDIYTDIIQHYVTLSSWGYSWHTITSLAKEVMFLVALVSLSVCLFVCGQHYSKSCERIGMKFYRRVLSSTMKNWLNFGGDLGIVRWVNEQKKHRNSGSIPRSSCR